MTHKHGDTAMRTLGRFFFSLLFFVLFALFACNSPTEPGFKNPREYAWTIDTLAYPESFQTTMYDIWGSSPNDVYAVGRNARGFGKMFHFDGSRWKPVGLHPSEGGIIEGIIDLSSIYGFDANNIYAVGARSYQNPTPPPNFLDSSLILHYNGQTWTEYKVNGGGLLQAVWGIAPNDIWAGGTEGTMFHYDGTQWTKVPIPNNVWINSIGGLSSNDVYATAYIFGPQGVFTIYLLHWDGNTWGIQDSFVRQFGVPEKFGCCEVKVVGGELFTVGVGVFRQSPSGWQSLFSEPTFAFTDISGISSTNLFVVGSSGYVYHYNGSDWYLYDQLRDNNVSYQSVWSNNREVFIVGFVGGGETSVVQRGR